MLFSTIHFETLGCKVNQIESESAARSFIDSGFTCTMGGISSATPSNDSVILCIVNTCTVTAKAEQKARRIFRLLLDKYPYSAILVTGCYAQLEQALIAAIDTRIVVLPGLKKDLLADLPLFMQSIRARHTVNTTDIPRVLPSTEFAVSLSTQLLEYFNQSQKQSPIAQKNKLFRLSTDTFLQHSRSSIKIQDGCNSRCSYCRICFARGKSVSLEPQEVLKRIIQLEKAGHHEVVITGINLSQYKSGNFTLTQLLSLVLTHTKTICIRVSSLYPQSVTDELCAVLAHNRIQPHFHLSVQSGSDSILTKMARAYTARQIEQAVEKLRATKINPFIACDIIAGFPGETEEDFAATLRMCQRCNFTWIHAFPFSPRPGTAAFTMHPQVLPNSAAQRIKELTSLALSQKKTYIERCIGKNYRGIVEKHRSGPLRVVTENFLHVQVDTKSVLVPPATLGGTEVQLRIDRIDLQNSEYEAFGTIIY